MTQKEKQLLLKDICNRLPYDIFVQVYYFGREKKEELTSYNFHLFMHGEVDILPYLRPLSSMTEEESAELSNIISEWFDKELFYLTEEPFLEYALSKINYSISPLLFDWLNAHHFDYRGLISKGLAIAVTKENNPYL